MKKLIRSLMSSFGWEIRSTDYLKELHAARDDLKHHLEKIRIALGSDDFKSQILQDIFVASYYGLKREGYFVEFGATNGIDLSNTYGLEKHFAWTGIVAEPAPVWTKDLRANRDCIVDTRCVWTETGANIDFRLTSEPEYSGVSSTLSADRHVNKRKSGDTISVQTIVLSDMLREYGAPKFIDYLSIDTEGSEYDILSNHDFEQYRFGVITCEHNFTPDRERIYRLLRSKGYKRVATSASQWDDWYIDTSLTR
jgi:FkbM family methyltransferase